MLPQPELKEDNLLSSIWLHPRATFEFILSNCPQKHLMPLLVLGSLANVAVRRALSGLYGNAGSASSFFSSTFIGLFVGVSAWLMFSVLLSYTGRLMQGKGTPREMISMIAWSMVPTIFSLALFVPHWILVGDELFHPVADPNSVNGTISFLFTGMQTGLLLWSTILLVCGISVIQGFGLVRSALNLLIPGVFLVVTFVLIFGQIRAWTF